MKSVLSTPHQFYNATIISIIQKLMTFHPVFQSYLRVIVGRPSKGIYIHAHAHNRCYCSQKALFVLKLSLILTVLIAGHLMAIILPVPYSSPRSFPICLVANFSYSPKNRLKVIITLMMSLHVNRTYKRLIEQVHFITKGQK